jgi:hypothetical protein
MDLAAEASSILEEYQAKVPGPQPASVSPEACTWCPSAASCPAFWANYDATWAPGVVAARGTITWLKRTGDRVTLELDRDDRAADGPSVLRNTDIDEHPLLALAEPQARLAVVGLETEPDRGTLRILPSGRVAIGRGDGF